MGAMMPFMDAPVVRLVDDLSCRRRDEGRRPGPR
jgi:hypothetical protein